MRISRQLGAIAAAILGALVVIDGDTVRLDGKAYSLLGFDTAETHRARCAEEYRLGVAATRRLQELFAAGGARLEPTGQNCAWQRECARLYVNGQDVAGIMIREGHAVPYNGRGQRRDWCQ